jgi:hypothetical protein
MAAFDGQTILRTPRFNTDAEKQTFTLHRADNQAQFDYSMVRFEKISAGRYQGWSVAVPDKFEAFARERAFSHHWYRDFDGKGFGWRDRNILRPKERPAA